LEPAGFEIPLRNLRAEAALFREANLPLLVEDRKLGTRDDKIVGAQTIQWNGQELTLPQVRAVLQDPDRAVRERAWRLAADRWLADRAAINELWAKMVPLRRQIALNAGCANYREYRWRDMLRFDYTPADCETFHAAIEEAVAPAAQRIYARAKQRLGVDSLRLDCEFDRDPIHLPARSHSRTSLN
jgi:oligoendopeptidase F